MDTIKICGGFITFFKRVLKACFNTRYQKAGYQVCCSLEIELYIHKIFMHRLYSSKPELNKYLGFFFKKVKVLYFLDMLQQTVKKKLLSCKF